MTAVSTACCVQIRVGWGKERFCTLLTLAQWDSVRAGGSLSLTTRDWDSPDAPARQWRFAGGQVLVSEDSRGWYGPLRAARWAPVPGAQPHPLPFSRAREKGEAPLAAYGL